MAGAVTERKATVKADWKVRMAKIKTGFTLLEIHLLILSQSVYCIALSLFNIEYYKTLRKGKSA